MNKESKNRQCVQIGNPKRARKHHDYQRNLRKIQETNVWKKGLVD